MRRGDGKRAGERERTERIMRRTEKDSEIVTLLTRATLAHSAIFFVWTPAFALPIDCAAPELVADRIVAHVWEPLFWCTTRMAKIRNSTDGALASLAQHA